MNAHCYKIVFSKRLGTLVAVGEHTAGQGKANGMGVRNTVFPSPDQSSFVGLLQSVFASVALSLVTVGAATAAGPTQTIASNALPTGYNINSGNVAISAQGATMNIQQTSDKASINWNSFSVGNGAAVNVQQNSANSVLLNRVVGQDPSQILGKLTANGQVILINPNGVVFGKGGSVTASAFTASTFGMSEADFQNSQFKFNRNGSTAGVTVEDGASISATATGGYVALIGASVINQGNISTHQGTVGLASGESVLAVPLSGKVRLELAPSTIHASVENSGTITTEGGQVLMQAAAVADAVASVTHTGTIDTTGEQGGRVDILADHGHVRVRGTVMANSTDDTAGGTIMIGRRDETKTVDGKEVTQTILSAVTDASGATLESKGGFIETSGSFLKVDDITVKAKDWLLDPTDITISLGTDIATNTSGTSIINRNTLQNALVNTNVTITTASSGTGNGDITVADSVTWTSGKSLTLNADRNIVLNAALSGKDMTFNAQSVSGTRLGTINTNGGVLTLKTTNALATDSILGNISGSGSLVKTGAGTVTLSGAKAYTGGTTVSAGKLVGIDGGGADYIFKSFGAGEIKIESGAAAFVDNKSGTAHNLLRNKVSGGGTLEIWGPTSLGNARTMVFGDFSDMTGTIALLRNNTQLIGDVISSGIVTEKRVNTKAMLRVGPDATLNVWSTHGTPIIGALTGSGRVTAVVNGSASMTIGNGGGSGTFDGQITNSGTISITKIGAGTQTLIGNNNYTGTTTVNEGSLVNSKMASLRTPSIVIAEGATFEANVGSDTTYLGSTTVSGGGTFKKNGAGVLTLSNGTSQLIFGTTGSLVPSAPFTGSFDIANGAIRNEASKGAFAANGSTIKIASGSWLDIRGEAVQMRGLTGEGNIINSWNSTNALTFGVGSTPYDNFIYNGVIGAAIGVTPSVVMNVTKSGDGTQVLAGINLYTGTTTVSGGTLQIGNGGATGTLGAGAVTLSNDANLVYKRSSDTSIANAISGQGNVSADISGSGNLIVGNTINLSTGTPSDTHNKIDLRANGNVTLSNAITTNNTGPVAVKLVAGRAESYDAVNDAWSSLNGNVIVAGTGTITVGTGGVAALYSGTIDERNGIAPMAASGSGKFRYNSDETTANFNSPLVGKGSNNPNGVANENGVNIIYREAPEITVIASSTPTGRLTYNGSIQSDPNAGLQSDPNAGYTSDVATAGWNGDGLLTLNEPANPYRYAKGSGATLETVLKNAGTYTKTVTGLTNNLGYKVKVENGSVVIDQATLSNVTGSRSYNASKDFAGELLTGQGVGGETVTFTGTGNIADANVQYSGSAVTSQHLSNLNDLALADGTNGDKASNYKLPTLANTAVTINPKEVTLSAARDYNGTKDLSIVTVGTGVTVGATTETLTYQDAKAKFKDVTNALADNAGAANYVESITLKNATDGSGGLASNYKFTAAQSATNGVTINAKEVTLAATKTYDGNRNLSASQLKITTGVGSETLSSSGATINSKNVADNLTNYVDAVTLKNGTGVNAGLASNYKAPALSVRDDVKNTVLLSQLALTANISDVTTTYGTNAGTGRVNLIGVIGADDVSANSAGLVVTALSSSSSGNLKAGTYVQSVGGDLTGTHSGNYTFSGTSSNNYVVNKLGIRTQIADVTTTYGTAANTGTVSIGAGLTGDAMTVVSTGPAIVVGAAYSNSGNLKAGSYQQAASARLDGADSGNYFIETPAVANYVVKKLDLTGAYIAGVDTTYGNTTEKGALSFANVIGADQVGAAVSIVDAATSTSGSLKVGSYKQTASVLTGADGSNYQFGGVTTATANYNVAQKLITTANVSDVNTVYGTPAAVGTVSLGADAIAGDKVQATSVATLQGAAYSSSNNLKAGAYTQSIAAGLSGDDASNYIFEGTQGKANFVVSKLALTGATIADASDVYGTPQSSAVSIQGVIAGDKVSGKAGVVDGQYSSSGNLKVGSYQQKIAVLQGDDGDNYSASHITSDKKNYDVTPRSLAATYLANNKVVDGNTNASVVGSVNAIAGDKVTPTHTSATFDNANVGVNKTVTISGISLTGADASNYVLDPVANANNKAYTTASIVAAQVNLAPTVPNSKQAKAPVDLANPFQLASAEEPEDDICSATKLENCVCEEAVAGQGVSICYEPNSSLTSKR